MTRIIATVGPMIASEKEINKLLKKNVYNYWVNYGLKKNSFEYLRLLNKIKQTNMDSLSIFLELPSSRCRHVMKTGEIKEDKTYTLYDEKAKRDTEKNYMVMSGLSEIMNDLEVGEKIYYEDGICICCIREIDKMRDRLRISCDISCDANYIISEGSAVSFNGKDKNYEIIREEDRKFLSKLKKNKIIPDYFAVSFCKNGNELEKVRSEISEILNQDINLLAKIQNRMSVKNIDEIIINTEGVVIERGDLIYVLEDQLPCVQKMIIEKAQSEKRISIVASGFMSEFSKTSTMKRSEQSDVYRLKEECCDFLLLTKETGKAPHALATVDIIQKILGA